MNCTLSFSRLLDRRVVAFVTLLLFIYYFNSFFIDRISGFGHRSLPLCPLVSPKLIGWTNLSSQVTTAILNQDADDFDLRMKAAGVKPGGMYEPSECQSRNKVAIIVPIRNRQDHLTVFLRYMHPFLQRQQLNYVIVVVEQSERSPFNRGMLMNIGFKEMQNFSQDFPCVILHDVDMLPEHDENPYTCAQVGEPRQMAFCLDYAMNYKPVGLKYFGAVTAFASADFQRINGFSNSFWGWGAEDDQLYMRVLAEKLAPTRTFQGASTPVLHYKTLFHEKAKPNPERIKVMEKASTQFKTDGLVDLKYKRLDLQLKPLYTHILVDIEPYNNTNIL